MKITEIRIDRTKSLGNYENIKLGFTAVIGEDETTLDAIERGKKIIDWEINREEREQLHVKYTRELGQLEAANGNADPKRKGQLERWFARYDQQKAEVEAIQNDVSSMPDPDEASEKPLASIDDPNSPDYVPF